MIFFPLQICGQRKRKVEKEVKNVESNFTKPFVTLIQYTFFVASDLFVILITGIKQKSKEGNRERESKATKPFVTLVQYTIQKLSLTFFVRSKSVPYSHQGS